MPENESTSPATSPDADPTIKQGLELVELAKKNPSGAKQVIEQYIIDYIDFESQGDLSKEAFIESLLNEDFAGSIPDIEILNTLKNELITSKSDYFYRYYKGEIATADVYDEPPEISAVSNVATGGDPINLFNGNFNYAATDFFINGAGIDFSFNRNYSQHSIISGILGSKWDHNYNLWLRGTNDENLLFRSNGALREITYKRHTLNNYWLSDVGEDGIIFQRNSRFIWQSPEGTEYRYSGIAVAGTDKHMIERIEDRFGNYLHFYYSEQLLIKASINAADRSVFFSYDSYNRLRKITDFTGREWKYSYDDFNDLVAVTTPSTAVYKKGLTTFYEYSSSSQSSTSAQHNLICIIDADGNIYLENEYGIEKNLLSYNRVVRQRIGNGELYFEFSDVVEEYNSAYQSNEIPACQTIVTGRNGMQQRYLFNSFGNVIFKEEYARINGIPKLISSHFRYNKDGNLTAMLSPLGVVVQYMYGRDFYEKKFPQNNEYINTLDPHLTREARKSFNRLLSVVKRAGYYNIQILSLSRGLWASDIFPDIFDTNDLDIIQKYVYEDEFSQLLSVSDPRHTYSTNPDFAEPEGYTTHLINYKYRPFNGFRNFYLDSIESPVAAHPDGSTAPSISIQFPEYDEKGRLTKTILPNGLEKNILYHSDPGVQEGHLTSVELDPDHLSIKTEFEIDSLGRIIKSYSPRHFESANDRFFSIYEYNELNQVIKTISTSPFLYTKISQYNRTGNVSVSKIELKDKLHNPTSLFEYHNKFDQEFHQLSLVCGNIELGKIKKVIAVFDRSGRPYISVAASGFKNKIMYDERGFKSQSISDYGGIHSITKQYYDADGRCVKSIDANGNILNITHDALGRPIVVEDAKGNKFIKHYDKANNVVTELAFEKKTAAECKLLARKQYKYDEVGRLICQGVNNFNDPVSVADANLLSLFTDSGPGRLCQTQYFYNSSGNVFKTIDWAGKEFKTEFDLLGRTTKIIDPYENESSFTYDKESNVTRINRKELTRDKTSYAILNTKYYSSAFAYDELNRLTGKTDSLGNKTHYTYDSLSNIIDVIDPLGNIINNRYDIFGRLTSKSRLLHNFSEGEEPVTETLSFEYNLFDLVAKQIDSVGRQTNYFYDSAGRQVSALLPDGSADLISYDRMNHITKYKDRNGQVKNFRYNELNRNTNWNIENPPADAGHMGGASNYSTEYDGLGRVTKLENDFIRNHFHYNSLGINISEEVEFAEIPEGIIVPSGILIARECNDEGLQSRLIYPSGRALAYKYDILNRLIKITQDTKGSNYPGSVAALESFTIAEIEFDGLKRKKFTRSNNTSTEYFYDFGGRLVEVKHQDSSQVILDLQCLYNAIGDIRWQTEVSGEYQKTQLFKYDSLSRISETLENPVGVLMNMSVLSAPTEPIGSDIPEFQKQIDLLIPATGTDFKRKYNYDLAGNRLSKISAESTTGYEPNNLDQYRLVDEVLLTYDKNGNLIEDESFYYEYDHSNLLTKSTNKSDHKKQEHFYDSLGRRIISLEEGIYRIFIYDGNNLIEEYENGILKSSIVSDLGQDNIILSARENTEYYFYSDLIKSVRYLYNGNIKYNFYEYDEFGNVLNTLHTDDENQFRFGGKRLMPGLNKYDYINRIYDPVTGRFIQRDPKGFVDGTNLYSFLGNNPLNATDPFGTERAEHNGINETVGSQVVKSNPKGFTLEVPNNFDNAKVKAYKQRVNDPLDRGVGLRSHEPGLKTKTQDIRAANKHYVESMKDGLKQRGQWDGKSMNIDHTVELQHVIRGNKGGADTVRPQDHRPQDASLNKSQGSRAQKIDKANIEGGVPTDVPAGGVARTEDLGKFWNSEGYRTGMRYFGWYNLVGGTGSSLFSIGDDIREGDWAAAGMNTSAYLGGALEIGGLLSKSAPLLKYGKILGAPAAVASSAVVGWKIGTNLYENYVDRDHFMSVGENVEELTNSRVLGALAASAAAVQDAINHIPEAAWDYATETWTVDPDEIDWGRTFTPWNW